MTKYIYRRGSGYRVQAEFCMHFRSLREARIAAKKVRSDLVKMKHDIRVGVKPCCTIREEVESFLYDRLEGIYGRRPCNEKTAELYRRRLYMFDRVFHSAPLDAISDAAVAKWIKRRLKNPRRGENVSRDTVNAEVDALKAFARWAQWKKLAPAALPLLLTPRLRSRGKLAGKNRKPPKVIEMHRLLDIIDAIKAVRPDMGLFFMGMIHLNLRPSEAADLKMADVVLPKGDSGGMLDYRRLKTVQEYQRNFEAGSPIHEWLLECISLAKQAGRPVEGDGPLIICIEGKRRANPGGWTTVAIDQATARVCQDLGISFTPYQVRHSVTSYVANRPEVSRVSVQMHAGHANATTTDIYTHGTAKDAIPAYEAVESLILSRKKRGKRKVAEGKEQFFR